MTSRRRKKRLKFIFPAWVVLALFVGTGLTFFTNREFWRDRFRLSDSSRGVSPKTSRLAEQGELQNPPDNMPQNEGAAYPMYDPKPAAELTGYDAKYAAGENLTGEGIPGKRPAQGAVDWANADSVGYTSMLSPGALIRMRTRTIRFFTGLEAVDAEPPGIFAIKTVNGTRSYRRGSTVSGSDMNASWLVTSFQGSRGWDKMDVPWFLSFQKRPTRISLTKNGLEIEFPEKDTGYIFSMPLYGFEKLPQKGNDLCAANHLPSRNIQTWQWIPSLPGDVVKRCDWWAAVAKAYPVSFSESYSVDPSSDTIVFHQSYDWLTIEDAWSTKPICFATLSPALGLAWKTGFPVTFSSAIHDPDYFTGFGPYVGALDVDRLDISMNVLQYINELEYLEIPDRPDNIQKKALARLQLGMKEKFQDGVWRMDYGEDNFVWSMVQDVWYSKGLEYVDEALRRQAVSILRDYYADRVIKAYTLFKGRYIVHGPGIGSWDNFGDAGKFATNMLQGIWGYGQYTGDWDLIRERWEPFIKKYFVTPEEANWVFYGRESICELGDEAPPCSAYARMAYAVGDYDEYAFGCYMFARELVHHWIQQKGGTYFYEHQPHQYFEPMPARIYPTNVYGNSTGWQVDGPTWGPGERQSSNRWVRFHDPDTARFYRDYLASEVREELDWYNTEGRKENVYRMERYRQWTERDETHILTGLARLRSFLLGERYPDLQRLAPMENYIAHSPAEHIAVGYAFLRSMVPVKHRRVVPRDAPSSPPLLGLQRRGLQDYAKVAQECYSGGGNFYPAWYVPNSDWGMTGEIKESRRFGGIEGNFNVRMNVEEQWIGYGCQVAVGRLP